MLIADAALHKALSNPSIYKQAIEKQRKYAFRYSISLRKFIICLISGRLGTSFV